MSTTGQASLLGVFGETGKINDGLGSFFGNVSGVAGNPGELAL